MKGIMKRLSVMALAVMILVSTISVDVLAIDSNTIGPFKVQTVQEETGDSDTTSGEDSNETLDEDNLAEKPEGEIIDKILDEGNLDEKSEGEITDKKEADADNLDEKAEEKEPEIEMCDLTVGCYVEDSEDEEIRIFEKYLMDEFPKDTEGTIQIPDKEGYDAYLVGEDGQKTGIPVTSVTCTMSQSSIEVEVLYVPKEVEYTVIHNFQGREPISETLSGKVGAMTSAKEKAGEETSGYKVAYINQQVIRPSGTEVTVYYYYETGHIVFDSQGGSFVDPMEVNVDDVVYLRDVAAPTKVGYAFDGWYDNPEGTGEEVTELRSVTETVTLYAKWNPEKVKYTINYWKQKVTDKVGTSDAAKTYDFVASGEGTALAGDTVTLTDDIAGKYKNDNGFRYNAEKTAKESTDVVVEADGTTVLNVYYDRVKCTVLFLDNNNRTISSCEGLFGAPLPEGTWDTSDNGWYYASDGKDTNNGYGVAVLLTSFDFKTAGYSFTTDSTGDQTCRFWKADKASGTIYYYNEQAKGGYKLVDTALSESLTIHQKYEGYELYKNWNGITTNNWPWTPQPSVAASFFETSPGYGKEIEDGDDAVYGGKKNKATYIISRLKTYELTYHNYNEVAKTEAGIKYTAPLAEYGKYEPEERPSGLPDYYSFIGWYADQSCTREFDFEGSTMPNANLQVYAKWAPKSYKVVVHYNDDDETKDKTYPNILGGTTLADSISFENPEREGYVFTGWYLDEACIQPCSASKVIEGDIDIYAKWEHVSEVIFTIRYEDEQGKSISDEQSYTAILDKNGQAKITVAAKSIDGYVALDRFQEVTLDINSKDIVITFVYRELKEEFFVLRYVDEDGIEIFTEPTPRSNDMKPRVRVNTAAPKGYTCDRYVVANEFGTYENPAICVVRCTRKPENINPDGPEYDGVAVGELKDVVYNGLSQEQKPTVTRKDGAALAERTDYTISFSSDTTNVGTVTVTITGTGNYTGTVTRTYDITHAPVTVTAQNNGKVYGGTEPALTADVEGLVNRESKDLIKYDVTRQSGEAVKTYPITASGDEIQGNYKVTYVGATFTISASNEMSLSVNDGTQVYNGEPLSKTATATITDGTTITYSVEGSGTWSEDAPKIINVGSITVLVKAENPNYTTKEGSFTLTVTHAPVEVKAEDKSKVYGEDDPTLTAEVTGTVNDADKELIPVSVSRTAGETVGTYPITAGTNGVYGNYKVTYVPGNFTITARSIEPEDSDNPDDRSVEIGDLEDVVYNGLSQEQKPTVTRKDGAALAEGTDYTVSFGSDTTNVGTVTVTITGTGNYTGTVTRTYDITGRPLKIKAASDKREYNGSPLRNSNYDVEVASSGEDRGLVGTDAISGVTVTGVQIKPGKSPNVASNAVFSSGRSTNYNIEYVDGELEVTSRTVQYRIKVVPESAIFKYDGAPHSVDGFASIEEDTSNRNGIVNLFASAFGLNNDVALLANNNGDLKVEVDGNEYTVSNLTASRTETDADTYEVLVDGSATVKDSAGNDVTSEFYIDTTAKGSLIINKRQVTLQSQDGTQVYNGNKLTKGDISVGEGDGDDGFAGSEGASYTVTGEQTLVGESSNTFEYKLKDNTKAKNYNIIPIEGRLTVTDGTNENPVNPDDVVTKVHDRNRTYSVGDTITFTIKVTNIYDEDKTVTIEELLPNVTIVGPDSAEGVKSGTTIEFEATYTVTREDVMSGSIINTVRAAFSGGKTFENDDEVTELESTEYTLRIHYRNIEGATLEPDYVGTYYAGELYRVATPVVGGYTPQYALLSGNMPKRNLELTVLYTANPAGPEPTATPDPGTPPVEPDPGTPPIVPDPGTPPVVPEPEAAPAPLAVAAPAIATIPAPVLVGDEEVPLAGEIIVDDDGNVSIVPIEEEEIPLADRELDDNKCCILSFLLMLATLIIYSWFTHSMKKRQKKLAELKDQLAEETLKRQLGITDTGKRAR